MVGHPASHTGIRKLCTRFDTWPSIGSGQPCGTPCTTTVGLYPFCQVLFKAKPSLLALKYWVPRIILFTLAITRPLNTGRFWLSHSRTKSTTLFDRSAGIYTVAPRLDGPLPRLSLALRTVVCVILTLKRSRTCSARVRVHRHRKADTLPVYLPVVELSPDYAYYLAPSSLSYSLQHDFKTNYLARWHGQLQSTRHRLPTARVLGLENAATCRPTSGCSGTP